MKDKIKKIQWTIKGQDRKEFLQGQLTTNLSTLEQNYWIPTAYCSLQGKVLAIFWLAHFPDHYRICVSPDLSDTLEKRLRLYTLGKRITIEKITDTTLTFTASTTRTATLAEKQLVLGGIETNNMLTLITAKLADITVATSDQFLPQMLGLEDNGGLSYEKGCYVGQEVIARAHYKGGINRHLQHLIGDGALSIGQILQTQTGVPAATILQSATDTEGKTHALAVVQDRYIDSILITEEGQFQVRD